MDAIKGFMIWGLFLTRMHLRQTLQRLKEIKTNVDFFVAKPFMSAFIHGKLLAPVSGIQIINLQRNPALGIQFHVLPEDLVHWYIGVQFHVLPEDHYLMFCPAAADDIAICLRFAIAVFPNCLLAFITSTI